MEPMEGATTVERMLMGRAKASRIPVSGSIELLPLCNMSCEMCYVRLTRAEMEAKGRLRTAAEWLALGQEMQRAGVLFLLLTGGEPLIYPDFKEVYLGLRKLGMVLTLNTNGTLLNEEWADFFAQNKPRRINITLYGADERTYERLCHYPGGFEKTLDAIRALKERGVDVRINVSVTPENVDELERLRAIGAELEVPVVMDSYMLPAEREREKPFPMQARLLPEAAAKARLFCVRTEIGEEAYAQYVRQTLRRVEEFTPDARLTEMDCMAGKCSFTVNWQGALRPCVIMDEPEADVFEQGFERAWRQVSARCDGLKLNDKCAACQLRPVCKICPASAKIETGDWDGVPDYLCRYARETLRLLGEEALS